MIVYSKQVIGMLSIKEKDNIYNIEIRQSNCLSVFVATNTETNKSYIYDFFSDEQHLKNIIKSGKTLFFDKVVKIRLNLKYKENFILLKHLVKFYNIECYYE